MKTGLIVTLIAVPVAVGGFFLYRSLVPPSFEFEQQDDMNHSGIFTFAGVSQSYGNNKGARVGGRSGWDLDLSPNSSGQTVFSLYKNGNFVKQLAIK